MKFSVLIPCRNRLDNLKNAVASVLIQDYQDFEVIISDNDSAEDLRGFVASLNDPRIRYSRTETFISVTDNWNRTVEQITGDYVVMLGDDDCLMNGYFSTIRKLALEYSFPDLIYSDAFLYAYPGVLPNYPKGHLRTAGNCSFWKRSSPFCLDRQQADQFAEKMMSFKFSFSFNMQYATIHRSMIEKLKFQGSFFHSPYPDYYAMTLLLIKAHKILICPYPMTIIGISPKSFGYFYFNNKEAEGMEILNNMGDCSLYPELARVVLPGSMMNTCWLYALASLQKNYSLLGNFKIDIPQYRRLQIMKFLRTLKAHKNRISLISHFVKSLRWSEMALYSIEIPLVWVLRKVFGGKFLRKIQNRFLLESPLSYQEYEESYSSVLDIVKGLSPQNCNQYIDKNGLLGGQ